MFVTIGQPAPERPKWLRAPAPGGKNYRELKELIAGLNPPDDAAVYRAAPELAISGTLDFFPPLVDDPRTFGEIGAANALSDVFAMVGRVREGGVSSADFSHS